LVNHVLTLSYSDLLETVAEACRELGSPDVKVVQMDVADTKSVSAFFDEKTTEYGIDLFIANAGISHVPDKELLDHAEPIFQVNVMGALAGINSVYKAMRKRGRGGQIAVVSSVLGLYNPASMLCYSASKAAILSYCRDLRALGKDDGITVNIIAPGYIDTAMTSAWSKKNAFFFLKSDYFGEQVKKGLENDVSLISLPFSQFLPFAIAAALPVFAKESLSQLLHVLVDSKLMKKNQ
jgi:NAD(P)-dependent dehydrogenase (short-subunit alcohol dehydrogenase family)